MSICLLYHHRTARRARFYRIELAVTLFDEVSVLREWGVAGRDGTCCIETFANLREASNAADTHRARMLNNGYQRH
ncbi:MAG: WGR domain-containing protein [Epibacterium sp.]|jgi:predicted DNA-binding WGR domain protein|nr:WGR domain-containing protein [Epibacterium sp.]NQX75078.1 WGR domain-containing protein [Epibacterium sp.]